ncbi:MAG TPA: DUF222 domain-containing protein [Nakamurella sp.]
MGGSPAITTAEQADSLAKLVLSGIELLGEAALYRFTRAEQLDHGQNLEDMARALYATRVGWVRELENSGAAAELSYSSTRTLLRDVLLLGVGEASDLVRAATMTLPGEPLSGGDIPARLPQVGDALLKGELGAGQVAVITKAVSKWPKDLDPQIFDDCEKLLVEQGRQVDPGQLTKLAQQIENIVDPDGTGPDHDPDPVARMELRLGVRNPRTGLTPLTGTLCDEAVEAFRQATDPLAAPRPAADGVKDTRSPAHRLAQAHLDVLRGYLDAGDGPSTGRQVPHITMTIDFVALTRAVGDAALDFGGPVGPATARRLLCDAQIMPVVLGGDGLVLDVGRAERTFPPHLRRALALRDGGCAWPGCDRPPGWCEAHHIIRWLHGGETCLQNGVLLCGYHHRLIHGNDGWVVRMAADGRPDFIPPSHIDPQQRPLRNHRLMVRRQ